MMKTSVERDYVNLEQMLGNDDGTVGSFLIQTEYYN